MADSYVQVSPETEAKIEKIICEVGFIAYYLAYHRLLSWKQLNANPAIAGRWAQVAKLQGDLQIGEAGYGQRFMEEVERAYDDAEWRHTREWTAMAA